MKRVINKELWRVFVMRRVRKGVFSLFKKGEFRNKDINDLVANILFFREDDPFFPLGKKGVWKEAARNKLRYMYLRFEDDFDKMIDKIEEIFETAIKEQKKIYYQGFINIRQLKNGKYTVKSGILRPIYITKGVYEKLRDTIKKEYLRYTNEIIFLTMVRYEILLNSKNHQLGIQYAEFDIQFYDVELFASPINRTLDEFCGAYPDIDKYYRGSLGSFFDYKFESEKKYTMNPPYVDLLMTMGVKRLLSELDRKTVKDVVVFITIPIWDHKTLKKLKVEIDKKIPDKGYKPYELLKKSKYLDTVDIYNIKEYQYYNHLLGRLVSAAHTYHIIFKK